MASRNPAETIFRASGKDGPQIITAGGHRWTEADELVFLEQLAASCNVRRSAAAAGFSTASLYWRRRNHPDFARRWHEALAQGYARLEAALLHAATDTMEGKAPDPETPFPPMTVKEAIAILQLHRATVRGDGATRHAGWRARPRSLEEVRDSILTKLEAIEAARREA